jgi:dipeptidyl aminopeptidase/acylaminoacyl peptidase
VGGLNTDTFVEPELVRYPSTDGVQVPAFLYRPRGATGKVPVVVVYHGGPEGQSQPTFSPFVQLLVSDMKMAVLLPNVRGSDGYGKAYRAMDDGVKREASLADIGATLDFIAARKDLDPARVGVYGGSYGGYMTLAAAAFYPERIRAAVDVVGISSIATFLENTQAYRRDLRRAEYGDERVPEVRKVQERISPLNAVDKIRAALFVQQGKNDPRVPQSEAEQIVKAVRGKGADVWYLLALDEGHGFGKKSNRDYALITTLMFFEKHLGGTAPAGNVAPPK